MSLTEIIHTLLEKAASAENSEDAARFALAAMNAAHTRHALAEADLLEQQPAGEPLP